jgi:hypothetical protein
MSNEHTPGPWSVEWQHPCLWTIRSDGVHLPPSESADCPNARLIAAAPELLSLAHEVADASETIAALLCSPGEASPEELVSVITDIGAKATALVNETTKEEA